MSKSSIITVVSVLVSNFTFTARAVVPDGAEADVVIGRQQPNSNNVLSPCVAVDQQTQKVFVGDTLRHRILRFASAESLNNGAAAEAVLGQPDFTSVEPGTAQDRLRSPRGLWIDANRRLWVADAGNNRVLRFDNATTISTGALANGVLGQVNFDNSASGRSPSTLSLPSGLVTDSLGHLYVADTYNYRVLRFSSAASLAAGSPASGVLGQPDFYTGNSGLHGPANLYLPYAVAISPNPVLLGQPYLWVADSANNRVLRFNNAPSIANGTAASRVLGQAALDEAQFATTASGMDYPTSLAADSTGRLYVGERANHRVLRFDDATSASSGAAANGVLGQAAFNTKIAGSGPGGLDRPQSLALGTNGRLWIADQNNHRVLRHEAAQTKVNGADANGVLGAPTTTTDLTRAFRPQGVAIDPVSGKLFVSDQQRNRVLRFASITALASGDGAEAVFGQSSFSGGDPATTASRMREPSCLAMDSLGNLWVADEGNRRVLRFNNAAQRATGTGADGLLGQPNFNANDAPIRSPYTMGGVRVITVSTSGTLWVSDGSRVLRFDNARLKGTGAPADGVLGQGNFSTSIQALDAYHFVAQGLALDPSGRLWVNDYSHFRVLRFDNAAAKMDGAAADGVLGQNDFLSANDGGLGPDGLYYCSLLAEPGGRLWVADGTKNRATRWEHAATRTDGTDADGVLGQPDFGFGGAGEGLGEFRYLTAMARDAEGHLWIADRDNERIVRFSPAPPRLSIAPLNGTTVRLTLDHHTRGVNYGLQTSADLQSWAQGGAFTASHQNPVFFDKPIMPGGRCFFRFVELP